MNDGLVGEYDGLVGEYDGLLGLNDGLVGEYDGLVGAACDLAFCWWLIGMSSSSSLLRMTVTVAGCAGCARCVGCVGFAGFADFADFADLALARGGGLVIPPFFLVHRAVASCVCLSNFLRSSKVMGIVLPRTFL